MKVIEAKNLSFSYEEGHPALDGVSFCVEEGSYVALIGHNGSGKSTLAKVLMGLIAGFQGEVRIFNLPLDAGNLYKIRSRLGIVFQNPDNQFVGSSVRDDIAFGLENRCVPHADMEKIIVRYADEVGMSGFLDKEPQNLSGGQKQRVAIAGVLAMNPDVVIFDEATAMLDPKGKREISAIVARMRKDNPSLTLISITHDLEEAAQADQVIVLEKGKVFMSGKPAEIFSHVEELRKIGLDAPFLPSLVYRLKALGVAVPADVTTLDALEEFLCR